MFESITPESIKAAILAEAGDSLETREGSFLDSMAGPAAVEIWKVYQAMNAVISIAFPDESAGGYLDLEGAKYGITRKPGTRARCTMTLTGTAGSTIPAGTVFLTLEGLEFALLEDVLLTGGSDTGTAEATEIGSAYNVEGGAITRMVTTVTALSAWTNASATGGTDPESDAALYERIRDFRSRQATSGNAYHYEQWAMEVAGVGGAKIFPLWNGAGTVKVVLVDADMEPASSEIVAAAAAHIEEERPIGATVTVAAAQSLSIHVAAKLTLDGSTTLPEVKAVFASELDAYLKTLTFRTSILRYNQVAYLLLSLPGVLDFTSLTLNGGTGNVSIGAEQVPALGEVTLT
ncbi:baseplate J/gp47 family protein [Intestinimonas sp.]|uniref:baseplate J/gp47 family protein n=1 Tax=Intestinimonas sp. TaxID=1965293 RepID=UPI003AB34442